MDAKRTRRTKAQASALRTVALALRASGMKIAAIAEQLGLSYVYTSQLIKVTESKPRPAATMPADPPPAAHPEVWDAYLAAPSQQTLDAVLASYPGLLDKLIAHVAWRSQLPAEEISGDVYLAMVKLVDSFDRKRSSFETYCLGLIFYRFQDEYRAATKSRGSSKAQVIAEDLYQKLRREPTEDELRQAGVPPRVLGGHRLRTAKSIHQTIDEDDSGRPVELLQLIPGRGLKLQAELDPDFKRCLTMKQIVMIYLLYQQEMTMARVAEILGLSESRISQLHTATLEQLRAALGPGSRYAEAVA